MQNKETNYNLLNNLFVLKKNHLQKGQKVVYEGEEAYVIGIKPLLVIKAKKRVICGALEKRVELI